MHSVTGGNEMSKEKITIDEVEYNLDELSGEVKDQLTNIQFVDMQIQQLNNELSVSDTARIGYTNALKAELAKIKSNK
jgi:hypothetical protein